MSLPLATKTPVCSNSAPRGHGGRSTLRPPRGLYQTPKKNLVPRAGLAYKLTEKTVLRAGYGVYYGFLGQRRDDVIQTLIKPRLCPRCNAGNSHVYTTEYQGYSWYHSLQLGLRKRFSRGYTVDGNYTFSKFMQATELLNGGDLRPTEILSESDRPHRLNISGILELPFGAGRRFGNGLNPVLSRIVSGWQLNGIYAYQSGAMLEWGNIIFTGDINDIRLAGSQQGVERWFNTEAGFEKASAKQLASNARTFPLRFGHLRADSPNNREEM